MRRYRRSQHQNLLNEIGKAIENKNQRMALLKTTNRFREARFGASEDFEEKTKRARDTKDRSIGKLSDNIELFTNKMEALGGNIFCASSGKDAVEYIIKLAKENKVKLVSKSKSMTSEEISLNEAMEKEGIQVIETDLGERIVQLGHERPSHIIAPAVHRTKQEVAHLFSESIGEEVPPDIYEITKVARKTLRNTFLDAGMGIVGVNIAIAETGSIIIVTNEGNEGLVSSLPPIVVAIMGMEKLVTSIDDAVNILDVLPKSATGQKITSYISILTGLNTYNTSDGRQFHIIILDNGRTRMKEDPILKDALNCIRCGACMNVCPTYKIVGGHVFGHIYPGPIGIPWTDKIHGFEEATSFSPLCISCGLCEHACPVDIDIPMMIASIKHRDVEINGQFKINRILGDSYTTARMLSSTAPFSNWFLRRRFIRQMIEKFIGIDRRRPLPRFHRKTFEGWFHNHVSKGEKKVAYFVDTFANYNDPEIGIAAVNILEKNNSRVALPKQKSSGMPYISYGDLDSAKKVAEFNVNQLTPLIEEGFEVVATEPTAAYCLTHIYPSLLGNRDSELVSAHSHELFGYLMNLHKKGEFCNEFGHKYYGKVGYHQPCHSKPLLSEKPVVEVMKMIGLDVEIIDHGCCGMAGTFGLKKGLEGYDLSMEIGKELFNDFKGDFEFNITESSVCKLHIEHGSGKIVNHPAELLSKSYQLETNI